MRVISYFDVPAPSCCHRIPLSVPGYIGLTCRSRGTHSFSMISTYFVLSKVSAFLRPLPAGRKTWQAITCPDEWMPINNEINTVF